MESLSRYKAILFDVGNTLVRQESPDVPVEQLRIKVLPGVLEALEMLNGKYKMGLVSNSKNLSANQIREKLELAGIAKYFETAVSSFDIGIEKPDPEPLQMALNELGVNASESLYIGDNDSDRIAAKNAGMDFMFTSQNLLESLINYDSQFNSSWHRAKIVPLCFYKDIQGRIQDRLDNLVKPKGSLGRIEELLLQLSGITGDQPSIDPAAIAIFIGDHGIAADNSVTPWPQDISRLMADLIVEGKAAASVMAKNADIYVEVINVGLINPPSSRAIRNDYVAKGTKDFRQEDAMSLQELMSVLEIGADAAERLVAGGSRTLAVGEVGIGNTTSSAILIGLICKESAESVTGRGSGIPEDIYLSKLEIIKNAICVGSGIKSELEILAKFGGFEIAAMVGFIIRAATLKVPIILDGISTLAAALIAHKIRPEIINNLIAGHLSAEPASRIATDYLRLNPILNLDLRLGEGTGALLSIPILRTACTLYEEMGELNELLGKIKQGS